MKKLVALLTISALMISMTACGGSSSSQDAATKSEAPAAASSAASAEEEAAVSETEEAAPAEAEVTETPAAEEQVVLKFAEIGPATMANGIAVDKFAELIDEKCGGRIKIEVFHDGVLGGEAEQIQGLQMGTIDMSLSTPAYLSSLFPKISLFDQPYLFTSWEDAHGVIDGEIGQKLYDEMDAALNIKVLGSVYSNFRIMNSTFPINSLADLKGRKMRAPEADTYIKLFQALGANPTPIPFGETYTAIDTGVVDGVEVAADIMVAYNFHEVTQYCAITNHIYSTILFCISDASYEKIPEDLRDTFKQCVKEATDYEKGVVQNDYNTALETMKDAGLEITYPDLSEFQAACAGNQDEFAEQNGCVDLLEEIRAYQAAQQG